MRKKVLLTVLFAMALCALLTMPVFASASSVVGVPEYFADWSGEEYFFANGAAVTVEARTDSEQGALVKWTENGVEKSQVLGTVSNIFGGMHDNDTAVTTSITINGGYVNWIHGGGLHKSNTTTSNIVMNGGQVGMIKGGAADQWIGAVCGCTAENRSWHDGDYENSPAQTGTANVTINGGKIEKLSGAEGNVFGGGNGYANTDRANVTINGGDLTNANVTAGGSHGNTTEAIVTVTGGEIRVLQTVNRGTMENVGVVVSGGTVTNLYVGGDEVADANATTPGNKITGTITGEVAVAVISEASVENMSLGLNGGTPIDLTTSTVVKQENILVQSGTVENMDEVADEVTTVYEVRIDDDLYIIQEGFTIKDLENYNDIITKDGYEFKGFTIAENAMWNPDTPVTENLHLTTVFEKIETPVDENTGAAGDAEVEDDGKDESPKMGVESTALTVFAVVAVISLAGIALIKRANRK